MQPRLNADQYHYGYLSEMDLQVNHLMTAVEMLLPSYLATRLLLGDVSADPEVEAPMFFVALFALYRAKLRASVNYSAQTLPELEDEMGRVARRTHDRIRWGVCLFKSPEEISRSHQTTRLGVGLAVAVFTVLWVVEPSALSHQQELFAGTMVLVTLIAAYELMLNARANHFGARVVEVGHASELMTRLSM